MTTPSETMMVGTLIARYRTPSSRLSTTAIPAVINSSVNGPAFRSMARLLPMMPDRMMMIPGAKSHRAPDRGKAMA
ncbi:hypothetical protein D3C73_1451210 [compost metagenome]